HRRACALCQSARLRRLQSEPGYVRRLLAGATTHRPLLVPVVRKDGGARRAGDGACQCHVQSSLPPDRLALSERRHHRFYAVLSAAAALQRFPNPAVHHSAWRRRGSVPLGPLSRHEPGYGPARADRAGDEEWLVRHWRLASSRYRPALLANRHPQPSVTILYVTSLS